MNPVTAPKELSLARPDVTQHEIDAVVKVLQTPHLSLGPIVPEFERRFAELCQTPYAVACNSGTSALHLVIRALGLGPGDEVITTPFSFVASANCILFENARPVFADIDPDTWCIDAARIEAAITPRTRAIIPVDVFGITPDMDAIRRIADQHGLFVLEDSCEAVGGTYNGRPAGSLGDAGVFGFYPNKQITTGEGGMIVTHDENIAKMARSIRNQGRGETAGWLAHERLGYNFRLSDVNCALGCAQLDRLAAILAARSKVAGWYDAALAHEKRVSSQRVTPGCHKSWFVYVVRLADEFTPADRDRILDGLRSQGIACNNYFSPIHLQPFYREQFGFKPGDFAVTERLAERTIALPFHAFLEPADVQRVVAALGELLSGVK